MPIIGGQVGYTMLRFIAPGNKFTEKESGDGGTDTKIEQFFGKNFFASIQGKTVIDFGCGCGDQSVEMARKGAARVIGVEIQEHLLERARLNAKRSGASDRCVFAANTNELADVIISKDAFEHFADPAAILQLMRSLLRPDGCVLAAFGPTWLHPYGGHLFSVFPWSHLLFTEKSQIRWRADFKTDGATRFTEVAGGLNKLTIAQFERIVAASPFRLEWLDTVPIKGIAMFKTRLLREFGSSIVRCKLSPRDHA